MQNLFYIIAVIIVVIWALGFFVYGASGLIHLLLIIAIIVVVLRLIKGKDI